MVPRPKNAPSRPAVEPPTLEDAVIDLTGEVRTLAQQVEVPRVAVDDLRQELEFALRNWRRNDWAPTQPLTSMPRDPLAEDFTVNRKRREDVPTGDRALPPSPVEPAVAATTPGASGIGELF